MWNTPAGGVTGVRVPLLGLGAPVSAATVSRSRRRTPAWLGSNRLGERRTLRSGPPVSRRGRRSRRNDKQPMWRTSVLTRSRASRTAATGCLTALLAVTGVGAAQAATSGSSGTRAFSRQVSFAGTAFATGTNENVDVTGDLHLVTRLTSEESGWTLNWDVNLDSAAGTGGTTGDRYIMSGAAAGAVVGLPPGPPVRAASFEVGFTLLPPGPPTHPPSPIRLLVTISFDATGQLIDVQIHPGGAPPIGTTD